MRPFKKIFFQWENNWIFFRTFAPKLAFCPYIFVITTADNDNDNNKLNDNIYEKKD